MSSDIPVAPAAAPSLLPQRPLGQTGTAVTLFGLGGEGVLRTYDRAAEAVRVIHRALDISFAVSVQECHDNIDSSTIVDCTVKRLNWRISTWHLLSCHPLGFLSWA